MLDLDEKTITEAVLRTMAQTADERIRTVLGSMVRHLHEFVREVAPTEAEWAGAIDFLTRTGQKCDDRRQEFILLSDVLGVTMLVDAVNYRRGSGVTENSVQGPFYRQERPEFADGADISNGVPGTPLLLRAVVVDTAGAPIAGAEFDVWHADGEGRYDTEISGLDDAAMRGLFRTGRDGTVSVRSIAPAAYPIPDDGPVGELMRTTGRPVMRPGHIHVRIAAPGFSTVTTMLFRDDDPHLGSDPVFGSRRSLLYPRDVHDDGQGPFDLVERTFVLDREH